MSTEQSVDQELVEQTKQQIRNLVREIAQLSRSDIAPSDFYNETLNRIVQALAAVGGAVWTVGDGGRLELEYQINFRETQLIENQDRQVQHGRLLRKVLTTGEGMLVGPHSGSGDEEEGSNPTDFLLVLGPLKSSQQVQGVIEIFQRPGNNPNVQRGYLRFLLQICELAGDFLKSRQLRHFTDRQTLWAQLESFTRVAHQSLDPRTTAYIIANEGRRLIECDRVSVAIRKGNKYNIEAVSGQDTFDRRSNTVSLLSQLATAVAATGEPVWYTGDTTYMAPQVEEAVQEYVDDSHSKAVGIIPLKRPRDLSEAIEEDRQPQEVLGALIVEQIEDSRPKEGLLQRVEVVTEHSSTALANALEYNSLFLMPLWRSLGRAKWVVQARTLPKTVAIAGVVVVMLLVLAFWPASFDLEGKGELRPATRREVFAGVNGIVNKLAVEHGAQVTEGQVLAEMTSNDLDARLADIQGQVNSTREQVSATRRAIRLERRGEEQARLEGMLAGYMKTLSSLEQQLKLLRENRKRLQVVSPIAGEVHTMHLRELLINRPVERGQRLMTVADPAGEWELEIRMPESRMGHITQAMKELNQENLDVTYILATDPGRKLQGKVKEIHRTAEVRGDEGNTVLLRVAINKDDVGDLLRSGAGVTAKVHCGSASLGYVWFHDLISFVQSKILFRL